MSQPPHPPRPALQRAPYPPPPLPPTPPGRPAGAHPGSLPPGLLPHPAPAWTDALPWLLMWGLVTSALCFVVASAGAVLTYVWAMFLVAITFGMVYDDPDVETEFTEVFSGAQIGEALHGVLGWGLAALPGTAALGLASWFVFRAFNPSRVIAGAAVLPGVLLAALVFVGISLTL